MNPRIARTADDPAPASDELFAQAVDALGREGLADLLALIGYYTAVGIAMKLPSRPRPVELTARLTAPE